MAAPRHGPRPVRPRPPAVSGRVPFDPAATVAPMPSTTGSTVSDPPVPHDPIGDRAGHTRRLGAFLRWLLPIAAFFGAVQTIAFIPTGNVQVLLTGLIILAYTGAVVAAQRDLRHDRLESAVRTTSMGILAAAVSIAVVQPELWTPLGGIPFVAVGIGLPTARGRALGRLLVASGATTVLIAALGALNLVPSHLPGWFLAIFNAGAVGAVAILVLVLLFQFSDRLTAALDATVAANHALVRTQAELESERERLDTTLRSIGDGVVASDSTGAVVFLNPVAAQLTGWTPATAIGRALGVVLDLRHADPDAATEVADRERDADPADLFLVALDGTRRPVALATSPIAAADGTIHGSVAVVRDVTDERRLARERREIDRRILESQKLESLATLAGGIAQQFNNLLVVILGNAAIARDELRAGGPDD